MMGSPNSRNMEDTGLVFVMGYSAKGKKYTPKKIVNINKFKQNKEEEEEQKIKIL